MKPIEVYSTIDQMYDIDSNRLVDICQAERDGRLVVLPCKVGDAVYVVTKCEDIQVRRDDDYFMGTGATECPFESTCDIEECDDDHFRVFGTTVTGYWIEEGIWIGVFVEDLASEIYASSFGKTVFLTREAAEAALKGETHE